jgi:LytR cell envelope-related transcriptional attenuator
VTTAVVLAIAVIAVVAGFLILRSITEKPTASDGAGRDVATTTAAAPKPASTTTTVRPKATTTTTTATTTTTTLPSASKSDATVVVANASGIGGSATAMTAELAANGYTVRPVANATGPRLDRSTIYYVPADPTALAVAHLLAAQIPAAQLLPLPDPSPLDRPLRNATVVLMLGRDAAGHRLAELQNP